MFLQASHYRPKPPIIGQSEGGLKREGHGLPRTGGRSNAHHFLPPLLELGSTTLQLYLPITSIPWYYKPFFMRAKIDNSRPKGTSPTHEPGFSTVEPGFSTVEPGFSTVELSRYACRDRNQVKRLGINQITKTKSIHFRTSDEPACRGCLRQAGLSYICECLVSGSGRR
jgi:hypothetical protein